MAILTDLIKFEALLPFFDENGKVDLKKISMINIENISTEDFIIWMDSHFFSQTGIVPTAKDLNRTFGIESPHYVLIEEELKNFWSQISWKTDIMLKYELWSQNMELVYGNKPNLEIFIVHTYLVTLIKLIVYLKLEKNVILRSIEISKIIKGDYFVSAGINNLIEEDFFQWILDETIIKRIEKVGINLIKALFKYDLDLANEDLFKEIYEGFVKLGQRHKIGEYYTPEWLSKEVLDNTYRLWKKDNSKQIPKIIDPACGSGTFLTNAIKLFKSEFKSYEDKELLNIILTNIVGIDINPLAIITSRANYLISLGNLIYSGERITIPIYNADSVKVPEISRTVIENINVVKFKTTFRRLLDSEPKKGKKKISEYELSIPFNIVKNSILYGEMIQIFRNTLKIYDEHSADTAKVYFKKKIEKKVTKEEYIVLITTLNTLISLSRKRQNSIWIFMLNNFYIPILFKELLFDILIGNPPWIVMRHFDSKDYMEFLKQQIFRYQLLPKDEVRLYTDMEMATYFYCRTMDLYLKKGGIIGYLLPINVLYASQQHQRFRQFKKPKARLMKVLNFENVRPLFSLPTCCLISRKGEDTVYPVPMTEYGGIISAHDKNSMLSIIKPILDITDKSYSPPILPKKNNYSLYYKSALMGPSIVPRTFWFVAFDVESSLPIDLTTPRVSTPNEIIKNSKAPWKSFSIKKTIESDFIYATLLGRDMIPFGIVKFRPVVLPLEKRARDYHIISLTESKTKGFIHLHNWFKEIESYWKKNRTEKSKRNFPSVSDRLDYQGTLKKIPSNVKYFIVWNMHGADSFAYVVNCEEVPNFSIREQFITPKNFIPDYTLYYLTSNNKEEAHYLCAVINSPLIHTAVKPFQPRGKYGKRDIGRLIFKLSIPKYNNKSENHKKLVELSIKCHNIVKNMPFTNEGFRARRNAVKKKILNEYKKIDGIVKKLI